MQQHADAMERPLQHEPDREEAQRARDNPQRAGVKVDERGKIERSDEAKHTVKKAQWITKDNDETNNSAEQVHGPALPKIMRNLAQLESAERWTQSNEEKKGRRPEAGGPGTGGTWSAPPDGTLMPNAQRKRGEVASTSHRTPNASSRRTEAHLARQRSTHAGQLDVQLGTSTNATSQGSPNHAGRTAAKYRSTRSNSITLHVAEVHKSNTRRSDQVAHVPPHHSC